MTANPRPLVDLVAGARPNFVKLAPVAAALAESRRLDVRIVHTGQHYDAAMSDIMFEQLRIPAPDVHLGVGSGPHGAQTARILERYEAHLLTHRPAATVVFGDVNSTVACALAAAKLQVPVVHVESGLRSFDRAMPEEINRILTDAIADVLFVSEVSGVTNLRREGVSDDRIHLVGNVMIDTLAARLPIAQASGFAGTLGLGGTRYGFVTLHRPSNVDDPVVLRALLQLLHRLAADLPLVFAVHPRTLAAARAGGMDDLLPASGRLTCLPPTAYTETLSLVAGATLVITDSGGLQEETSFLGVPCLTLRDTTERPVTTERGTSRLLGRDVAAIEAAFHEASSGRWPRGEAIPLWDGAASHRIASYLATWLGA